MKIVCGSCAAKYSIADEKVQGKVFKIRCRKCSNVIVVKGTEEDAQAGATRERAPAAAASHGGTSGAPEWYAVIDAQQSGPFTSQEIEGHYASGQITSESYIWRDSMSDWTPLEQVEVFAHLTAHGAMDAAGGGGFDEGGYGDDAYGSGSSASPNEVTSLVQSPLAATSSEVSYGDGATAVVDAHDWNTPEREAAPSSSEDPFSPNFGSEPYGEDLDAYSPSDQGDSPQRDLYAAGASAPGVYGEDPYGGLGSDPYGTPSQAEMSPALGEPNFGDEAGEFGPSAYDQSASAEPSDLYSGADGGYSAQTSLGGEGGGLFSSFDADSGNDGGLAYQSFSGLDSLQASGVNLNSNQPADDQGTDGGFDSANDLVGSRNENSVLFSLSSLQQVEAVQGPSKDDTPLTDGSGLIDIQSLASAHQSMSGSGMPGAPSSDAFGGPNTAPSVETFSPATMSVPAIMPRGSHRDNKPLIAALAVLVVVLLGGMVAAIAYLATKKPAEPQVVMQEKIVERFVEREDDGKAGEADKLAAIAEQLARQQEQLNAQKAAGESQDEAVEEQEEEKSGRSSRRDTKRSSRSSNDSKPDPVREPPSKPASNTKSSGSDIDDILKNIGDKDKGKTDDPPPPPPEDKPSKKKLGKSDVQNTVRKYNSRVKTCGKSSNSGNLSGKVWIKFDIKPAGSVSGASITSSDFKGTDVGNCVLKVVRGMKFPSAQESTSINKYPFFI